MTQPESAENSPFAQAWLEALAREEAKASEGGVKRPKLKQNDSLRFSPALIRGTRASFIREVADVEAEDIAERTAAKFEASTLVFDVRKPTVHIQPPGFLEEARRLRELPGKLKYSARKLGDRWSKWIDRDRRDGWRHIDPVLETEWNTIVVGLTQLDSKARPEILESFVDAADIQSIGKVGSGSRAVDLHIENKARYFHSYLVRVGAIEQEQQVSFSPVGIVIVLFEHISGLLENLKMRDSYQIMIGDKTEEIGHSLTVKEFCNVFGQWLSQSSVREYFINRPRRNQA